MTPDEMIARLDDTRTAQPWNIGWRYHEGQHQWRINLWRHPGKFTHWYLTLSEALDAAVQMVGTPTE